MFRAAKVVSHVVPRRSMASEAPQQLVTPALRVRPIAIAGPSGVGKSSLLTRLFKEHPEKFGFSVSHTTRAPRPGEVDGKNYWFTNKETMLKEISEGKFIEHNEYAGNLYGTSKKAVGDVAAIGKICVFDVDLNGILSLKKTDLNCLYVFIVPPSIEELQRRLRGRGDTSEEAMQKRLKAAEWELSFRDKENFWDLIVTNDNLERAYDEFSKFCLQGLGNK